MTNSLRRRNGSLRFRTGSSLGADDRDPYGRMVGHSGTRYPFPRFSLDTTNDLVSGVPPTSITSP